MAIPPPKHHDLKVFIKTKPNQPTENLEVWEIGVPLKNSLYWSIVLSYLLSSKDHEFSDFVNKLTTIENEADARRVKTHLSARDISFAIVKKRLKNFNPFKNRYVFFNDDIMINVFRTFKWKINNHTYKLKPGDKEWNDEMKLDAASSMLNCKIDVYFPDENEKGFVSYPVQKSEKLSSTIILFQYKNPVLGKSYKNIFRFAMSNDCAFYRKLSALSHILKKAKFSREEKSCIKRLVFDSQTHGKCFLPTILLSPHFHLMTGMYKSSYIALKLSEAGFETNPVVTDPEKPSALLLSMTKADTKYLRILYDYAANCRYHFDKTVRNADEVILDSLKMIHDTFANDKANMHILNVNEETKERSLRIQSQFCHFNEYQQNIATIIKNLREELGDKPSNTVIFCVRKKVIERILDFYLKYFHFNLPEKVNIYDKYYNYLSDSEYYESTDTFSCLSFFDNIHTLKKIFQLKEEDLYARVESSFFLLIISSKYFSKFKHAVRCNTEHDETNCERLKNVLRFIPFLHREKLKALIINFLRELNRYEKSPVPQEKIKDENLRSSLCSQPEIRDELLISRIKKYLRAAIDVSLEEDGIKGIFVIERALQVLGESIKPQSTEGCVVSCMLGSRLPIKLKQKIINIRNDMSHYRDSLVHGRMTSEEDTELFTGLKKELKGIMEAFEIVAFTQYLRLEESLMEKGLSELESQQLDENMIERFMEEYKTRLAKRKTDYEKYHIKCIVLSFEVINDLKDYLEENSKKKKDCKTMKTLVFNVIGKVRTVEYLFLWMSKLINESPFQLCLREVKKFLEDFENKRKLDSLRYDIECFLQEYTKRIMNIFEREIDSILVTESENSEYSNLETFLDNLKKPISYKGDLKSILDVVKISYEEALSAKDELKQYIDLNSFNLSQKETSLLQKLIIPQDSLKKLRKYFDEKNTKLALKELNKKWIARDNVLDSVRKLFEDTSMEDREVRNFLIKLVYQKHLSIPIYSTSKLSDQVCNEIDAVMKKKVNFLLSRISDIKSILIDSDDEIQEAWKWGRSKGIKYHMRLLMRQRFLKEMPFRASLEMALFDCFNILKREEFKYMFEKLNNLFSGINLRNVLSHGHSVLETVDGLLDEDDLPSELINKMINLIEDSEAIAKMLELFPRSCTLEKEYFELWIENNEEEDEKVCEMIKSIKKCPRWISYTCLLPLL